MQRSLCGNRNSPRVLDAFCSIPLHLIVRLFGFNLPPNCGIASARWNDFCFSFLDVLSGSCTYPGLSCACTLQLNHKQEQKIVSCIPALPMVLKRTRPILVLVLVFIRPPPRISTSRTEDVAAYMMILGLRIRSTK